VLAQIAMLREVFAKDRAPDDVWAQLLAAQPRLRAFLDDVRRGRFGEKFDTSMSSTEQQADPERGQRAYEALTGDLGLAAELKRVVGPQGESTDTLIASQRAYDFAHRRLLEERPGSQCDRPDGPDGPTKRSPGRRPQADTGRLAALRSECPRGRCQRPRLLAVLPWPLCVSMFSDEPTHLLDSGVSWSSRTGGRRGRRLPSRWW
jgi:hypothetical protein